MHDKHGFWHDTIFPIGHMGAFWLWGLVVIAVVWFGYRFLKQRQKKEK